VGERSRIDDDECCFVAFCGMNPLDAGWLGIALEGNGLESRSARAI